MDIQNNTEKINDNNNSYNNNKDFNNTVPKPKENKVNQEEKDIDEFIGRKIYSQYILKKKVGQGAYGNVYSAEEVPIIPFSQLPQISNQSPNISINQYSNNNTKPNTFSNTNNHNIKNHSSSTNNTFALKFENNKKGHLLRYESNTMHYLQGPGIPKVFSYGYSGDFNILVMELLGPSIESVLHHLPGKKMTIPTVSKIAIEALKIISHIHSKHIIHRDIKPSNFLINSDYDQNNNIKIYLLDFGFSKKYRKFDTQEHLPLLTNQSFTGTAHFASLNVHKGLSQSRRDDLESLFFTLVFLAKGKLPWQEIYHKKWKESKRKPFEELTKEDRAERLKLFGEIKEKMTPVELCQDMPEEFVKFLEYCRKLNYEEEPNYEYLKNLMITVLNREGFDENFSRYDWIGIDLSENKSKNKKKEENQKKGEEISKLGDVDKNEKILIDFYKDNLRLLENEYSLEYKKAVYKKAIDNKREIKNKIPNKTNNNIDNNFNNNKLKRTGNENIPALNEKRFNLSENNPTQTHFYNNNNKDNDCNCCVIF